MQNKQDCPSDMSSQPLVSFIVTTYNLPVDLLRECICSIVSLRLQEWEREIILLDDGSDESPLVALGAYADELTYARQPHEGLSVARNTAMGMAKGKYIQFVDGDDYLLPDGYGHCLDILRRQEPDIVVFEMTSSGRFKVLCRAKRKSRAQSTLQSKAEEPSAKFFGRFKYAGPVEGRMYMLHHNIHGSACCYVFRSSMLGQLRFRPGCLHEDEEFTPILFLHAESMIVTADKAYYYRRREGSITTDSQKEHVDKRLGDTEQILFRLKDKSLVLGGVERMALERRISQLTMDYLYRVACTGSVKRLDEVIDRLKTGALYPLPNKNYTASYVFFRHLMKSAAGRRALVWSKGNKVKK